MTRRWAGPVEDPFWRRKLSDSDYEVFQVGFTEAMNSFQVHNLYLELREFVAQFAAEDSVGWQKRMRDSALAALAAYEAGLEPEQEVHRKGRVVKWEKAEFETAFGPEDTWEESDAKA